MHSSKYLKFLIDSKVLFLLYLSIGEMTKKVMKNFFTYYCLNKFALNFNSPVRSYLRLLLTLTSLVLIA